MILAVYARLPAIKHAARYRKAFRIAIKLAQTRILLVAAVFLLRLQAAAACVALAQGKAIWDEFGDNEQSFTGFCENRADISKAVKAR